MGDFVQATEHDVEKYAKLGVGVHFLWIVVIKYSKLWFIAIVYNAIMHKMQFGQAYCQDLVKRILKKFILYFSMIYTIFYKF
jgi:hypothetical protein